jgi:YidC/Oxa1 family membrane protein insertase
MAAIKLFLKAVLYQPLFNIMVFFAWLIPGHSIGWGIIFLTLLVRLALWSPSLKTIKTPLLMRQYQGDIKEIQEKYKTDKAAQSQALMAFYKEKGVSPLAGCLPLLIQLPILLILYQVFITGIKDVRADLIYSFTPHADTLNAMFFGINLASPEKIFLPALAGILQFLQAKHMQGLNGPTASAKDDPTAAMSKQMMYIFPFMTFFIALSLPAGLSLYWIATTLFSLVQQIYVAKTFKPTAPQVAVTVRSKKH